MIDYLILLQNLAFEQRAFWRLHDNGHDKEKRIDNKCGQFREILWYFVGIFHLKHILFSWVISFVSSLRQHDHSWRKPKKRLTIIKSFGIFGWIKKMREFAWPVIRTNHLKYMRADFLLPFYSIYTYINSYMHIPFK